MSTGAYQVSVGPANDKGEMLVMIHDNKGKLRMRVYGIEALAAHAAMLMESLDQYGAMSDMLRDAQANPVQRWALNMALTHGAPPSKDGAK